MYWESSYATKDETGVKRFKTDKTPNVTVILCDNAARPRPTIGHASYVLLHMYVVHQTEEKRFQTNLKTVR